MSDEIYKKSNLPVVGLERKKSVLRNASILSGIGDVSKVISDAFLGHNVSSSGSPLPTNKDNQGYTFLTRPRLNLTYDNANQSRILMPMVDAGESTMLRAIRVLLDPVSQLGRSHNHMRTRDGKVPIPDRNAVILKGTVDSPYIDKLNPFMDIFSNTLISLSGWPDRVLDTFTSEAGIGNETYSQIDGYVRNYGNFDLTMVNRNIDGDPITALTSFWAEYMGNVQSGHMVPWFDSIAETEIDYQTRIYRMVMDQSRTKIRKIGSAIAAFPTADSLAASFNVTENAGFVQENEQITTNLRCGGAEYNDPIIMEEFNDIVFIYNPGLEKSYHEFNQTGKSTDYIKLSIFERDLFKSRAYPVIDIEVGELHWWAKREVYKQIMKGDVDNV